MRRGFSIFISLASALAVLALGIWSGKSLRRVDGSKTTDPVSTSGSRFKQPTQQNVSYTTPSSRNPPSKTNDDPATSNIPGGYFTLPAGAFRSLEVKLIEGLSLNKKECAAIGLNETQIQELSLVVNDAFSRWQQREVETMDVLHSSDTESIIHIPSSEREFILSELEGLKQEILRIGGADLEPLLDYRLTHGHTPVMYSNADTGLLNKFTAGFGTLERLVRIQKRADGEVSYEIVDFPTSRLEGQTMDGSLFEKITSAGTYEVRETINPRENRERVSHLPLPK